MGGEAMVMGDLVLLHEEVNPVMKKLVEGGSRSPRCTITLLGSRRDHVHALLRPRRPVKLCAALRAGLAESKTPLRRRRPPVPRRRRSTSTPPHRSDAGRQGIGQRRRSMAFNIPRAEAIMKMNADFRWHGFRHRHQLPADGGGKAAITGLRAYRKRGQSRGSRPCARAGSSDALHSHMLTEQPRLFFMHFWANDDPRSWPGAQGGPGQVKH